MVFAIHWHESATRVHVSPHPEPSSTSLPSLWVVPETGFESPASCIKLALVIYFTYGNIHASLLFSQIIPPLPSLTESKSALYICVYCAVLHNTASQVWSRLALHKRLTTTMLLRLSEGCGNLAIQGREQCVVLHSAYTDLIPTANIDSCSSGPPPQPSTSHH